ncbi:MAG: S8 family serine peptidase [Ilumatobacteraceae bacterium]
MRVVRGAVVAAVVSAVVGAGLLVTTPSTPVAMADASEITDPRLLAQIAAAAAGDAGSGERRTQSVDSTSIAVEVLTADDTAVSAAIVRLGGAVTGRITDELVQASVPLSRLNELATTPAALTVRAPRRAGYTPGGTQRAELVPGTGIPGAEIDITNAAAWHAAGFGGAGIKVGIVDYFDLRLWTAAEHGPQPSLVNGHQFCKDTSGFRLCAGNAIVGGSDGQHGVAVAEIVKDMAPAAELFIATVGTASDLQDAITWFAAQGVTIVTRSLGSSYDGPGDGTGPLASVVDYAASLGLVWFNSGGNDALDGYMRRPVPTSLPANGYVDFDRGAGVDTWLRLDAGYSICGVLFDGIRWSNDWYLPASQRTDYSLEFWEPLSSTNQFIDSYNPLAMSEVTGIDLDRNPANGMQNTYDAAQVAGAAPLEADDLCVYPQNIFGDFGGIVFMRVKRNAATPVGAAPDQLEIALGDGLLELGYYDVAGSASKPVVDSKNPSLVAVGAVDPPAGNAIGYYSSQGPTFDGRIKPDVSAPAGFNSVTFGQAFSGTSAAAPVAAGIAALLQGAGLAVPGRSTAALVKHFVADLGAPGPDNTFGAGKVLLPEPPAALSTEPGKYVPLSSPTRVFDSRGTPAPGLGVGPYAPGAVIDVAVLAGLPVSPDAVSAVAVNITSTGTPVTGFVQASPYLAAATGGTSTLNISTAGSDRPNFAIVPVGQGGRISLYLDAGGNAIVDVLGYFQTGAPSATDGRFVAIAPERWMDTRVTGLLPAGSVTPAPVAPGRTATARRLPASAVPATGLSALVVNVTAAGAGAAGYLVALPSGGNPAGTQHSTVNFTASAPAANTAIVPIGPDGSVAVYTTAGTHIILDVVGYITDSAATLATTGMFRSVTPYRAYDSRQPSVGAFGPGQARTIALNTVPGVAGDASAVSANLTVTGPNTIGFLTVYPLVEPATSNLNFGPGQTVANGALLRLSPTGTVVAKMSQSGHVLIDVNGFFLS